VGVADVAVADQDLLRAQGGQDTAVVDRLGGPVSGVHQREVIGAGHVHVGGAAARAGEGLVGVHHRSGRQQFLDGVEEPAAPDQDGGPPAQARGEPGGDLHPEQFHHQDRGPVDRHVVADHDVDPGGDLRSVLGRGIHPGREVTHCFGLASRGST
jgi:hypothetical protein